MVILREYQVRDIERLREAIRRSKRVLYVAPTGSGKGTLIAWMVRTAYRKGKRVIVGVHRDELVRDLSGRIAEVDVPHAVLCAGSSIQRQQIVVASIPTLARRLDEWRDQADFVLVDEGHHVLPENQWGRSIAAFPSAHIVSFTASPERLDGRGLGDSFEEMVIGPTVSELIAGGYLARFRCYIAKRPPDLSRIKTKLGDFDIASLSALMERPQIVGDAIAEYRKHLAGRPAVAFCVSVRHAEMTASEFRNAGYRAASVDGAMDMTQRRRLIGGLADGSVQVLASCALISEGLDIPGITGVIGLRPTQSLAMHIQQVGRALRPKDHEAIILDLAGNVQRHGLPDYPHEWTLTQGSRARQRRPQVQIRTCLQCYGCSHANAPCCELCGAPWPVKVLRPPATKPGHLVEASSDLKPERVILGEKETMAAVRSCGSLRELHLLARRLGKKPGWAFVMWSKVMRRPPATRSGIESDIRRKLG